MTLFAQPRERLDACLTRMRNEIDCAERDDPATQLKGALATIGECALTLLALGFLFGVTVGTLLIATLFGGS
jgi:hypothetical protein